MKAHRKQVVKKNLFQSDQEQAPQQQKTSEQVYQFQSQQQQPKTKNHAMNRTNQYYDAAKIQQNEMYIRKQKQQQELTNQKKIQEELLAKAKKKAIKNKKKNLFDSDDQVGVNDEDGGDNRNSNKGNVYQNQPVKVEIQNKVKSTQVSSKTITSTKNIPKQKDQQPQEQNSHKPQPKKQPKKNNTSDNDVKQNSQNSQTQQQKKRAQKIKQMLDNESKLTQSSKLKQISFSKLIEKAGVDKQKLKVLFYEAIPVGYRAICIFKRIQSGFTETYELSLEDDERSLFYCQNQRGSIGANYYISLNKEMDKKSPSYLGKLRGNPTGSVYQLYDNGKQPQNNINRREWRSSMGRIQYQTNFMGMNGPRKIKVILPNAKTMQQYDSYKLAQTEDLSVFKPPLITKYKNKEPRWNQRLKSYALNFGGRVKQASIKNFILVEDLGNTQQQFQATNNLVFGKINQNNFSLEVVHPLSLFQGFGIVMSQFDFKLNCE